VRIDTSPKRMIFVVTISDKRILKTMNRLIYPIAWKGDSQKFAACRGFEGVSFPWDVHRGFIGAR
jgi:hypothetical protein